MNVIHAIENGNQIFTITFPETEEVTVIEDVDCVIIKRKRTLAEAAEEIQKYVKREYTDAEINALVKQARKERWGRTHGKC